MVHTQVNQSSVFSTPLLAAFDSFSVSRAETYALVLKDFALKEPLPAEPITLLSSAPLTPSDIELGKKIAAKHGLVE